MISHIHKIARHLHLWRGGAQLQAPARRISEPVLPRGQVNHLCYVFYVKRPQDREAWPCVYESEARAWAAYGRISAVVPTEVPIGPRCLRCSSPDHVMSDCPHA